METDEYSVSRILPFQLQFDKPVVSQIKIAEWNPEKDLLAMVTEDSKILLHRFNWQRLWTFSPGRCITSLCWRPDGKAIAVGLQDGTISLHDVENGKLLRSMKSHKVAVACLNWEDDGGRDISDDNFHISKYEDRTSRFFPPAPRAPRAPGLVPGETGFMDENENLSQELSNSSHQGFNILCSADKDGVISFSIFGIFPIGKIDIHDIFVGCPVVNKDVNKFANFFNWIHKCVKMLMSEPSDQHQLLAFNSELVILFLKYLYDQDPVRRLLESTEVDHSIEVDLDTMERVQELAHFGGFTDLDYLRRTLAKEFQQMESCFKEAFEMPFTTISKKIVCQNLLPLFPVESLPSSTVPTSISYYREASQDGEKQYSCIDYVSFRLPPDEPISNLASCIVVTRCLMNDFQAVLLCVPDGYHCVDLSLYKECQLVVLLSGPSSTSENSEKACMMIVQADDLPFVSIPSSCDSSPWKLHALKDSVVYLEMDSLKVRGIPHCVIAPLAVSASRGVACVFATRRRALVYILDEDEDEISDAE